MKKRIVIGVTIFALVTLLGLAAVSAKSAENGTKTLQQKIEQYIMQISKLDKEIVSLKAVKAGNASAIKALKAEKATFMSKNGELLLQNKELQSRVEYTDLWRAPIEKAVLLGRWEVVGFCADPLTYQYGSEYTLPEYLLSMTFSDTEVAFEIEEGTYSFAWLDNVVIHEGDRTASRFLVVENGGEAYMFYEWKSGDYTIGKELPQYYVLKKTSK